MALTSKQRHELHQAIAHYLSANGFDAAHNEFVKKLGDLGEDIAASNGCADSTMLEKKWTAVVRLQKRVIELEAQVKQLQADVKDVGAGQPRQAAVQHGGAGASAAAVGVGCHQRRRRR